MTHPTRLVYSLPDGGRVYVGAVACIPREKEPVKITHQEKELGVFYVLRVDWEINTEEDWTLAVVKLSREP